MAIQYKTIKIYSNLQKNTCREYMRKLLMYTLAYKVHIQVK